MKVGADPAKRRDLFVTVRARKALLPRWRSKGSRRDKLRPK